MPAPPAGRLDCADDVWRIVDRILNDETRKAPLLNTVRPLPLFGLAVRGGWGCVLFWAVASRLPALPLAHQPLLPWPRSLMVFLLHPLP